MSVKIKGFTYPTMEDLWEYIGYADRDYYGKHFPFKNSPELEFLIYDGRNQVNIIWHGSTIVNFVFDDDHVSVYEVHDEIATYDSPHHYPLDTMIGGVNAEWSKFIDRSVVGALLDVLGEYLGAKQKAERSRKEIWEAECRYRDSKISEWKDTAAMLNRRVEEFNLLKNNYVRRNGTLFCACAAIENQLEVLCNDIQKCTNILLSPDCIEYLRTVSPDDISTIRYIDDAVKRELNDIKDAKEFLARYGYELT